MNNDWISRRLQNGSPIDGGRARMQKGSNLEGGKIIHEGEIADSMGIAKPRRTSLSKLA